MKWKKVFENAGREAMDLIWPPRCPFCGEVMRREMSAHEECLAGIEFVKSPVCLCCGKGVRDDQTEYCPDCERQPHEFRQGVSLLYYTGDVRRSLARFKYEGAGENAKFYAKELDGRWKKKLLGMRPEVLIPVPVHPEKKRERGYNQAELLARELGKRLELPVDTELLIRTVNTTPQKSYSNIERRRNLLEAFALTGPLPYRSVLLADDIYTTGATLDACAHVLLEHGAEVVVPVTVAIGGRQG